MTVKIYPYLTFENAKEAMDYYVQNFGAEITYHQPLNREQAENIGLTTEDLAGTTLYGEFSVAGQKIICADATMGTPQSSSLISIILSFGDEKDRARQFFKQLADDDEQRVTVPFGDWVGGRMMGQIVDRYGLTWIICTGDEKSE
ncbi:VOC family protein [Limosilactobacillus sp.]|uniref:VOC family protein n=1 Tax=Limosilactobacillus sp. TaxID=2773925 RepID=UPI003F0A4594